MNALLDRIDADPLATLLPQSARENERALAFALELTDGSPALDAVRGRGVLSSMIAEQRAQMEELAQSAQRPSSGFTRPSNRPGIAPGQSSQSSRSSRSSRTSSSGHVSADGSFALPAQSRTPRSGDAGSRISATTQGPKRGTPRDNRDGRDTVAPGIARAMAMSPAQVAMLGGGLDGSPRERLRTVDTPAYGAGASAIRSTQTHPTAIANAPQGSTRRYATNGSAALAEPAYFTQPSPSAQSVQRSNPTQAKSTRPTLSVLAGGKAVGKTRKKVLGILAIAALVTIAFAAVFMHASLARTQMGIDKLNIDITQAERMNQRLRVQVATLQAPDRIVSVAQELGLEPPRVVRFLPTARPLALAATRIVR